MPFGETYLKSLLQPYYNTTKLRQILYTVNVKINQEIREGLRSQKQLNVLYIRLMMSSFCHLFTQPTTYKNSMLSCVLTLTAAFSRLYRMRLILIICLFK